MTTQQKAGVDVPKAVRVAEAYCYDAGAPNAAKNLRAAVAELVEALRKIADFDGHPKTPVHSNAKMRGIARAVLARVGGAA